LDVLYYASMEELTTIVYVGSHANEKFSDLPVM